MELVGTLSLIAATLATGLMAGLFTSFAYAVMPALRRADDRTLVVTMQQINRAIVNGWFMTSFLGAPALAIVALATHWNGELRRALPWIAAGFLLYLVMFGITMGLNVPLNNQLEAAGDPDRHADLAAVRERFEARWIAYNLVRAVAATAAFGCLLWALVLHGTATG
ncbi:DUF1772 domain-containing protein [Plantactinospora sp. S1510]|uniref:DUF1772 domain-containing protein n=1 Tax=Plantactinospora alkalitolerans TaxID=2789879 RepID=A0ABS0H6U6_9ACTN|nr:anthrone oxygenase family protein [Plantactinospora alkalitolerans]MBF9134193.1 DUF1772 domain-containing protein [Plantactinospora alkalitolerans]